MNPPKPPRPIYTPGNIHQNAALVHSALIEDRTVILRRVADRLFVLALPAADTPCADPDEPTSSQSPREETTP